MPRGAHLGLMIEGAAVEANPLAFALAVFSAVATAPVGFSRPTSSGLVGAGWGLLLEGEGDELDKLVLGERLLKKPIGIMAILDFGLEQRAFPALDFLFEGLGRTWDLADDRTANGDRIDLGGLVRRRAFELRKDLDGGLFRLVAVGAENERETLGEGLLGVDALRPNRRVAEASCLGEDCPAIRHFFLGQGVLKVAHPCFLVVEAVQESIRNPAVRDEVVGDEISAELEGGRSGGELDPLFIVEG